MIKISCNLPHNKNTSTISDITQATTLGTYTYAGTNLANPHAPTAIGSTTQTYDNNGNLLMGTGFTNTWNYRNELWKSATGTASTTFSYDASGQRLEKKTASSTVRYISPDYEVTLTPQGAVATTTRHIYANGSIIASIEKSTATTTEYFILKDHLGSTNVVANGQGNAVQTLTYQPYGDILTNTKTGKYSEPNQYIGQDFDPEQNLSYLQARYMNSPRGQFISQDPVFWSANQNLANPQSLNSYSYADDNPINRKDPTGLMTQKTATILGLYAQILNLMSQLVLKVGGGSSAGNPFPASSAMLARSITIDPGPLTITKTNQQTYGNIVNQIQTSNEFSSYVKGKLKSDSRMGQIDIPAIKKNSLAFTSGDLHLSIGKVDAGLSGKQSKDGAWNLKVNISDIYNYEWHKDYGGEGAVGAALTTINNAAYAGQQTGVVSQYPVNINFDYTYKPQ